MRAIFAGETASEPTATGDDRFTRGTEPGRAPGFLCPLIAIKRFRFVGLEVGYKKKAPRKALVS